MNPEFKFVHFHYLDGIMAEHETSPFPYESLDYGLELACENGYSVVDTWVKGDTVHFELSKTSRI